MAVLTSHEPTAGPSRHRFRSVWVVGVFVLIAAMGAGVWVGRVTAPQHTESQLRGLATSAIDQTLADRVHAFNSGNATGLTAIYAPNAVLEERDQLPATVIHGNKAIADRLAEYYSMGFRLNRESVPVQVGSYVAEAVLWSGVPLMLIYSFDATGRIAHQWVIGNS